MNDDPIRPDLIDKVTGRATYVSDVRVAGMAYGKVVRSTEVSARLLAVHTGAALAMPGVVAVLTGADLAGLARTHWGLFYEDRPVIAHDRVRYVGEPVAVVVARTAAEAEAAALNVAVDYEDLPSAATARLALEPDAALVHETMKPLSDFYFRGRATGRPGTNVFQERVVGRGDVAAAEASAHRVFEHGYSFPGVFHYALEPHCAIASFDADGLTVWSGAQSPTAVQKVLARVFGLALAQVRVVVPYVGGGFGGKASVKIEPLAALAARKAGCPVKLLLSLEESMLTCRRLGAEITLVTGVDEAGRIVSRRAELLFDGGAYADTGPAVALKAAHRLVGPYDLPNLSIRVRAVYTNTVPGAAFRSIGGPQAVWATESHMDEIAHALGESPVDFRRRHLLPRGGHVLDDLRPLDADLGAMMDLADGRVARMRPRAAHNRTTGVALAVTDPGIMPVGGAQVRVHADGSVEVRVNSVEIGQGVRGVMRRIVAEALNQNPCRVHLGGTDTAGAPFDWGTGASRSTVIIGLAAGNAAADAADRLRALAAEAFSVAAEDVALVDGGVSADGRTYSFRELFHAAHGIDSGDVVGQASITPKSGGGDFARAPLFWETAAAACSIELDPDTGRIVLERYAGVADVGKLINPGAAEGQEEGACVQGLGHALMEELVFVDGQPMNLLPVSYRVPSIGDIAGHWTTDFIENGDGPGPGGAKGMGEGGILPIAPAIANALAGDYGIRIRDLPLSPERVWRALREKADNAP